LQAIHLLFAASRPVSVKLIEHTLGITYKSAWIMVQNLRAAERRARSGALPQSIRARDRTVNLQGSPSLRGREGS
jgi:hypothetical protein